MIQRRRNRSVGSGVFCLRPLRDRVHRVHAACIRCIRAWRNLQRCLVLHGACARHAGSHWQASRRCVPASRPVGARRQCVAVNLNVSAVGSAKADGSMERFKDGLRRPRGAEPSYAMAALLALGGVAGFAARRSKPSLIAGVVLGSSYGASGYAIGAPRGFSRCDVLHTPS